MTDLELNNFFKDIEFMPSYDIKKNIYSETINLDKYLFCSLNKRFNNYCLDWLKEKRANQTEYDLPRVEACIPYNYNPESNKLALIAENERNNHIVINHYTFCENQIEFEFDSFRLNGCYSIWYNCLYSEVYRFQKIMHELFEIIKSNETTEPAPPQQPEDVKNYEVKKELHNDIFKHNAFEVFEIYKENKQINVNSRTDLRVIFELLKGDNLLLKTIELKHYIDWLNRVYYDGNVTELKKQNLNSKPNIVRTNDYNAYKKTTLKQP